MEERAELADLIRRQGAVGRQAAGCREPRVVRGSAAQLDGDLLRGALESAGARRVSVAVSLPDGPKLTQGGGLPLASPAEVRSQIGHPLTGSALVPCVVLPLDAGHRGPQLLATADIVAQYDDRQLSDLVWHLGPQHLQGTRGVAGDEHPLALRQEVGDEVGDRVGLAGRRSAAPPTSCWTPCGPYAPSGPSLARMASYACTIERSVRGRRISAGARCTTGESA